MSTEAIWVTPRITSTELDGKTIELRISTAKRSGGGKETNGFGAIRIEPHRATSGMVCIWVMFRPPFLGPPEVALEQIEANQIQTHPDPAKADYLCAAQYAED